MTEQPDTAEAGLNAMLDKWERAAEKIPELHGQAVANWDRAAAAEARIAKALDAHRDDCMWVDHRECGTCRALQESP